MNNSIIKFAKKNTIPLAGIAIVIAYLVYKNTSIENYADCSPEGSPDNDMPESAAEACKRISNRAEEIKAEYGGIAQVYQNIPLLGLFNPNNYKSGDNTSTDMMRNIINVNLSKCEVEKIHNTCNNAVTLYQSNEIDTKDCKYCETNGCTISGNIQKNASKVSQLCLITTAIGALSEKKSSVDAQALAKVLQEAEGLLSGTNYSQKENCNIISNDLSSKTYLDSKSDCLNQLNSTQVNKISGCGSILNNIQENESIALQECMLGTKLIKQDKLESEASASAQADTDQKTSGLTLMSLVVILIAIVVVGGIGYYLLESDII